MNILIQTGKNTAGNLLTISKYESPEVIDYFACLVETHGELFDNIRVPIYFDLSFKESRNSVEHDDKLYKVFGVNSRVFQKEPSLLITNPFTKAVLAYLQSLPNNTWIWIPELSPDCHANKVWEIKGANYSTRLQAIFNNWDKSERQRLNSNHS